MRKSIPASKRQEVVFGLFINFKQKLEFENMDGLQNLSALTTTSSGVVKMCHFIIYFLIRAKTCP